MSMSSTIIKIKTPIIIGRMITSSSVADSLGVSVGDSVLVDVGVVEGGDDIVIKEDVEGVREAIEDDVMLIKDDAMAIKDDEDVEVVEVVKMSIKVDTVFLDIKEPIEDDGMGFLVAR